MKLTVDLAELLDLDIDDDDFFGDDFDIEIDLLNQKISYIEDVRKAFFNKKLARHYLSQDVAAWLFAALGDPKDTQKAKLEFVYVSDGKAAAMDGYRLHVHDMKGVADGAYYLFRNVLIEAKDAPKAPDWTKVIPKGDGELAQADGAEHATINETKIVQWQAPFKVTLKADYFTDTLLIGEPSEVHTYGSEIAVKLIWPNAMAVIMPMNI